MKKLILLNLFFSFFALNSTINLLQHHHTLSIDQETLNAQLLNQNADEIILCIGTKQSPLKRQQLLIIYDGKESSIQDITTEDFIWYTAIDLFKTPHIQLQESKKIVSLGRKKYSEIIIKDAQGTPKNRMSTKSYIHHTSPITALASAYHTLESEPYEVIVSGAADGSIIYYDHNAEDPRFNGSYLNQQEPQDRRSIEDGILLEWNASMEELPLSVEEEAASFLIIPEGSNVGVKFMTGINRTPYVVVIRESGKFQVFDVNLQKIVQELPPVADAIALFYHQRQNRIIICTQTGKIIQYSID